MAYEPVKNDYQVLPVMAQTDVMYKIGQVEMNFRSIADLSAAISRNLYKVPRDVDVIVGIPRSGVLAASILSLELNLPLTDIDGLINGKLLPSGMTRSNPRWISDLNEARHVLVIDDSILSGRSLANVKSCIVQSDIRHRISYAAVFAAENSTNHVDIYFEICPSPRYFSWNYLHHPNLRNWCVDIDGVLCCDPTDLQNDDGDRYLEFLSSAAVLRIPSYEIGWLVTSRLEKYRRPTETWLQKNGVQYRNLVMLEGHTAELRRRSGVHGKFKADVYSRSGADLFIESELTQAKRIAFLSGKPVICLETQQLINPDVLSVAYVKQAVYRPSKIFRKLRRLGSTIKRRVISKS